MKLNNFIFAFFILILSPTVTAQVAATEFDDILLKEGLVDETYKYTNFNLVSNFFRNVNNLMAESLPAKVNSEIEISLVFMTPYSSFFSYRYLIELDEDQKNLFIKNLNSNESIIELCKTMFNQKFLIANYHTIKLNYLDVLSREITEVKLTPNRCFPLILKI